jgi:hypothetical protein
MTDNIYLTILLKMVEDKTNSKRECCLMFFHFWDVLVGGGNQILTNIKLKVFKLEQGLLRMISTVVKMSRMMTDSFQHSD